VKIKRGEGEVSAATCGSTSSCLLRMEVAFISKQRDSCEMTFMRVAERDRCRRPRQNCELRAQSSYTILFAHNATGTLIRAVIPFWVIF